MNLRLHGKEIITGPGSLKAIKSLEYERYFIVTGKSSMFKNGTIGRMEEMLQEKKATYEIFSGIGANPTTKEVLAGLEAMKVFGPQCVLAVGGGSAIDAAKVMALMAEHPKLDMDAITGDILTLERKNIFLVAIPSTSGTATEVTKNAVVTYPEKELKIGVKAYGLLPDLAILDGELTLSMPKDVVAHTGMDAMTHALECYINHKCEEFGEVLTMGAVEGLLAYLPASFQNGDLESRQKVHIYQAMAGTAFHNIGLGMDHGISHAFGGKYDYGHGLLNAIGLPYVLAFNRKDPIVDQKLKNLEKRLGFKDVVEAIHQMNRTLELPASISQLGLAEEDYLGDLEGLLENALLGSTRSNPVPMDRETMKKVLDSIFYGRIMF
ncbi:iron-containing alcohol dehydrogenase [Alkalibacter rhizosphaerae]|uniref:Iron-containing alcohol dehydrogenase n=1 Tax=Alkalibacter rhizosphaerae TaxID=2815577 RepID=A0A975AGY9_9FIRM|nr:iron-containing alcohol dehydrogenase [Alkalibacter rhizosphaerae]QSX08059.1 iron-containing alcohol dehydrogenase [Alkalibacter rhizosphaerae]